jgi:hypothetical protein
MTFLAVNDDARVRLKRQVSQPQADEFRHAQSSGEAQM